MKLKFREKTYIVTLSLFLLFFNVGIFLLSYYTFTKSTDSAKEVCYTEEKVIAEAFANDTELLEYGITDEMVMISYCGFYSEKNIFLNFQANGEKVYGNLPEGLKPPEAGRSSTQRAEGNRYFLVSEEICGKYVFTYAKDVSYLDDDFWGLSIVFIITSIGASVVLALLLFAVLRKLSLPLEKLRTAASEISKGNFEIRADESGGDEISLLAQDFNSMAEHVSRQLEELEESAEMKQRMLDNLAHEMRTPLTSIRGYAEYLRDAKISDEAKIEAIEYIISESERLKLIGEKLLDEAFIRENEIKSETVFIPELIYEVYRNISIKNTVASIKVEPTDVSLNCDRLLISLLVSNLCDNALKACRNGGEVVIGCGENEDSVYIFVRDSGIGMNEQQLKHITEPFYRTDKSRSREEGGTGLGLSLCARIAKAHNALLGFESEPGKGTTATIHFYK